MSVEPSLSTVPTDELTLNEVRNRRDALIHRSFDLPETTLIEALPVSGKSYGVCEWAKQTGKPLTVFAPRHEILDEYESRCGDLDNYRLPSFYRDCASFEKNDNGEYQPIDDAARDLKQEYERGFRGTALHRIHSNLSCQTDGECPFIAKREINPDDYDVLLGTYRHAYPEKWMEDRYVAFDEFPGDDFLTTFPNGIAPVVSAYVDDDDNELPFTDYFDLLGRKDSPAVQDDIVAWKSGLSSRSHDFGHARQSPSSTAQPLAPIATLALLEMERLDNSWQYADLGYDRIAVRNPKKDEWTFLLPPDLSPAESVIGLDGTPNLTLWELSLGERIEHFTLLDPDERNTYLQDILGYRFVQTTEDWKAIQSGEGASPPKDLALIEGIAMTEERTPALISSKRAIRQYRTKGLDELTDTVEHYNNLKGMNDFGEERLGLVLGNSHPGDDEIEKWSALAGESAEAKEVDGKRLTGKDTDYGPFGNKVMHTLVHDEVLQAAMRFGREEVNGNRGATVYLHTSAIPEWLPVEKQVPSIQSWVTKEDGIRDTIEAIRSLEGWKHTEWRATALYDHTSVTEKQVRNCLEDLADAEYIECRGKKGQGNALHYANCRLEEAGSFGHVEFRG